MRDKGSNSALGAALQIQRRIRQITQDSAGSGVLPCAASIIKRVAHNIATYEYGVENMVHARQDVTVRHQRWVNGHLDRRKTCLALRSGLNLFHDPQQLDRVAKLPRELQIERFDEANAFDVNIFRIHPKAMRERSQNSDLVHRVGPIDI